MEDTNASLSNQGNEGLGDGNVATMPTFAEQLEGSLKADSRLTQYSGKTLSDFVKDSFKLGDDFKSLQGKLEGSVKVPGENATADEVSAYRKAVGVPDTPDGYKIERPAQAPDGWIFDETLEKKIKETAHQANSTPQQFNKFYQTVIAHEMELYSNIVKSIDENRQKAIDTLKVMWPGDAYKEKGESSMKSFEKFLDFAKIPEALGGKEGMKKWVVENGLGDDPRMVWMFSEFFNLIGDDRFIAGSPGAGRSVVKGTLDFSKSMSQK
ncbi:MAG: hypothetical protein WA066_03040 [Candidatus Omnitrophota bacterium]